MQLKQLKMAPDLQKNIHWEITRKRLHYWPFKTTICNNPANEHQMNVIFLPIANPLLWSSILNWPVSVCVLHINLGFLSEVGFFTNMGKGGNLRKTTGEWYREQKIINPHIHACLKCWTKPNGGHMSGGGGRGRGVIIQHNFICRVGNLISIRVSHVLWFDCTSSDCFLFTKYLPPPQYFKEIE